MPKITKRVVDAAEPRPDRFILWDSELKGFGLVVLPSGTKSYIFKYRTPSGVQRRATLGKHGALTPDEARRKADQARAAVAAGRDPLGEREAKRTAPTVADLVAAYRESATFKGKAAKTRATDDSRIDRHLLPLLGKVRVADLRRVDVERAHAAIVAGKTAVTEKVKKGAKSIVRGGEGAARKSVRLLRAILQWGIEHDLATTNVAAGVEIGSDGSRDTILEDAEAYGRLFSTLAKMQAENRIRPAAADAIRLIALTGARRGEVIGLRWRYVDLKASRITLPSTAHKTGKASGKPKIIGLPAAAAALVARQPAGADDALVFPPSKGDGPINLAKDWRRVRVEAELPEGIGLHGLRHSTGSHMAMAGASMSDIQNALGHSTPTMSSRYIHYAANARVLLAEKAASVALAGMAEAEGAPVADVVALQPRGRR